MAQQKPHPVNRCPSGGTLASEMFGFPIAENQFNALQNVQPTESQNQLQREEGLVVVVGATRVVLYAVLCTLYFASILYLVVTVAP